MFEHVLARCKDFGKLTLISHHGKRFVFDSGIGPSVTVRVHDSKTDWRLAINPMLAVGESYMNGTLSIEEGSLYDFIDIGMVNTDSIEGGTLGVILKKLGSWLRWWHQNNPIGEAQSHVAHHYDLSRKLFELFLDSSMQYSCAYFAEDSMSLAEAQKAKMRHIASKLHLEAGQRVLDIGCGWGGLALHLAEEWNVEVVGLTLSKEQHDVASERAKKSPAADRLTFKLQDYRLEQGTFQRIVSVGMFEHVGLGHYPEFFMKVRDLLAPDGVGLLHSIGRRDGPGITNAWLRKYIFPGGYSPALSEVVPVVEKSGLWISDIEILRLHYAETLRHWRENFYKARAEIARLYDERFCRMWDFYLTGSELSFRRGYNMVFQMQLCREIGALPLTRDYMIDREREPTSFEFSSTAKAPAW